MYFDYETKKISKFFLKNQDMNFFKKNILKYISIRKPNSKMDLEKTFDSQNSLKNNNLFGVDPLIEQKNNLLGFIQSEFDWESILQNLILSDEESSFELLEFSLKEMMTKNSIHFSKMMKASSFELMRQSLAIENCALLYEAYLSTQETPSFTSNVCGLVDQKLNFFSNQGVLNDKLFFPFFDNYMQSKAVLNERMIYVVHVYQRKVVKTFQYLIQPFYEELKMKNHLLEHLMAWIMILPYNQKSREFKFVIDIAKIIKSSFIKKSLFGFSSEIDSENFYRIMMFGFSSMNNDFKENEPIRADLNFCVILEMVIFFMNTNNKM